MRTKSGKKGWMAIKIDLEKAYDRLRWEFVKDTLEDIGIPSHLIQIIWNCISTTTMQVLWNGEALEAFSTSRGVRQGDPISPYLFVLCIERLFQVIELEVNYNSWKPIQIARGGPKISHLAFADDLLLFAEADTEQADLIQQTLLNFCLSSGQKVSQAKTRIYFSKNVPRMLKDNICNILGYQYTEDLGKYLGVPIFHNRAGTNTFRFVIDKVQQRLSAWKARTLSFAGRVTLAKSVLQAMPNYLMQSTNLPRSTCDEIDKLCRNFIWGDDENHHAIHLINWDTVCKPKKAGGLGMRSTRDANTAFMLKAAWQFCSNQDSLWVKLVWNKYKCGTHTFPKVDKHKQGSNFWNGLSSNWEEFRKALAWNLGNGQDIRFWRDNWLQDNIILADVYNGEVAEDLLDNPISNYLTYEGGWNLTNIADYLPANIIQKIHNKSPNLDLTQEDQFRWSDSPDGKFYSKSAYAIIHGNNNSTTLPIFKHIWKWNDTERIRTLLWKLGHEKLLTNQERVRRKMTNSALCPNCNVEDETLLHCFRDCRKSLSIWHSFKVRNSTKFFNNSTWVNWMEENLDNRAREGEEANWPILFATALDQIWRNRNDWVFNQRHSPTHGTIFTIRHQVDLMVEANRRKKNLVPPTMVQDDGSADGWKPPLPGRFKLNCDGSVINNGGSAGCGGALRDSRGFLLFAFAHKLRPCSSLEAELHGILHGINIAKERGFLELVVESDCLEAIRVLKEETHRSSSEGYNLCQKIRNAIVGCINVEWSYIGRELNEVADTLAKISHKIRDTDVIFTDIPDFLVNVLVRDSIGPAGPSMSN